MVSNIRPSIDCPDPLLPSGKQGMVRVAVDDAAAQLVVTFATVISPAQQAYLLDRRSYSLSGGQRLFPRVLSAQLYNPAGGPADLLNRRVLLQLNQIGDFSIYTLAVSGPDIDPFFAARKLRFRLACDDPFDCRPPAAPGAPQPELQVVIDYLAKDYSSFRQALLDFIPTRLPEWTERSEADIGMMLLELFAATADTLSYMQDRVANEAFLSSATQRRSVAEHLALIGYEMDEGAVAHTWLQFQVNTEHVLSEAALRVTNRPKRDDEPIIVFETNGRTTLRPQHNQMPVYNWGNQHCCLPRTALSAALVGEFPNLQIGDYVLFDDQRGHREVVRLTARPAIDSMGGSPPGKLTFIHWSSSTPLSFELCADKIIASGNMVVATHGKTTRVTVRELTNDQKVELTNEIDARRPDQEPRERLLLPTGPLAHLDRETLALVEPLRRTQSMTAFDQQSTEFLARQSQSVSTLSLLVDDVPWSEQQTLLESRPDAHAFRLEIDDQGQATVVFGDGVFGLRPDERSKVQAKYRVGGGVIGNLAADTLVQPRPRATEDIAWLNSVTNPLPAVGGRDLESRDHARRIAPQTFQKPLVAVTAGDYEAAAREFALPSGRKVIQTAKASFRWTGSWLTATVAVDPTDAEGFSDELRRVLIRFLDTRRLAGFDLEVVRALFVPIELAIEFCLKPGFFPGDVQEAIEQRLSSSVLPSGDRGFFHPDNFGFGDDLYISRIFAAVMSVPGVESAQIIRLAHLHATHPDRETASNLAQGYLAIGSDQIISLDNDRNFRENGTLTVRPKGVIES